MDGDGRAGLRRAVQGRGAVIGDPILADGACDAGFIIHHREDIRCRVRCGEGRRWTLVARRVSGYHRKLLAVCLGRRKGRNKVTVAVSGGAANHVAVAVGDDDFAAWLGGAGNLGSHRVNGNNGQRRWRGIHGKVHRLRFCALVTRRIGLFNGDRVRAFRERVVWPETPCAVGQHGGLPYQHAVVIDQDCAARLSSSRQKRFRGVGELASGNRPFNGPGLIAQYNRRWRCRRGEIHGEGEDRRGWPGVAGGIGCPNGKLVGAFTKIDRWGEGPCAVTGHHRSANSDRAIVNGYGGAGFCGTRELRTRIVSAAPAVYRPFTGVNIVRCAGDGWGSGRNRIDNKTDGCGCRTGIACRVGRGCGNGVAAVGKIGGGGKAPATFGIYLGGANRLAVIVKGDGAAWLADAAEGRAGIIGTLAVFQRASLTADIVIHQQNIWSIRNGDVRCGHGCARAGIPRGIRCGGGDLFAVGQRRAQVDGEFTVAAGFAGADDVAVGVFQRDGTARLGGTGDGFTIRRELKAGRRIRRSGIRIGRVCRRAGVAAVVIIVIPTAAASGACRRRDATSGDNATQYPWPDGGATGITAGCGKQDVRGGDGFIGGGPGGILNPP